jgi:hypothetical protein
MPFAFLVPPSFARSFRSGRFRFFVKIANGRLAIAHRGPKRRLRMVDGRMVTRAGQA